MTTGDLNSPLQLVEPQALRRMTARALLLGDRIDAAGLERSDMISSNPLAFRAGAAGFVALYRFGVAVMVGLSPLEEEEVLAQVKLRVSGPHAHVDDESAQLDISPEHEDKIPPGGIIALRDLSHARLLVVSDALAKTVSLGRDEREVNAVFDVIEPFAAKLFESGRPPGRRRSMLKLIGQTLLVQHRVSGRVAVEEKPDVLWDRPDLERLYARLEDEYELKERAETLKRKLDVIAETARALTDIIDADRATRLETTVVVLIVTEILLTLAQMAFWHH
ncbi:RMD1 family protein [Beijerinckia sp. L45]|uniref:RMD1 family protein n=1 Tax=Beijerinckia sp. L45 TaxID=1641855 RepID=UPI00131DBA44|nr:RMD1 family protein [Beijerinckia sp. L45]